MPAGIPVATMAIGKAGAANAAWLAASILALSDERLGHRLDNERRAMAEKVALKSEAAQKRLGELLDS
jgi:5-(carboxyamino)imidazole ribonucleotide mutase